MMMMMIMIILCRLCVFCSTQNTALNTLQQQQQQQLLEQQLQILANSPFGDSPLFRNSLVVSVLVFFSQQTVASGIPFLVVKSSSYYKWEISQVPGKIKDLVGSP